MIKKQVRGMTKLENVVDNENEFINEDLIASFDAIKTRLNFLL
jgi:hypothetical protein